MGLTDKLMQVVNGARKLWLSRDPDSYSRYEGDRDFERKRADHQRQAQARRSALARTRSARMASRSATPLNTNEMSSRSRGSGPTVPSVGQTLHRSGGRRRPGLTDPIV
jgi:hypothetical protein